MNITPIHLICIVVAFLAISAGPGAARAARDLKYPQKTRRTLWSDSEISQARDNVQRYPQAKQLADSIIKNADRWAAFSDDELIALITDSRVPRAFETGTAGCPRCGHKLYEKFGQYGWIIDPRLPFKVKCPVDGAIYPSNDYAAYYHSNFTDKKDWNTDHVDDGWGWPSPDGEKYWFVAYFNHWNWHKNLMPGLRDLGRAYLLTGDKKYAHKAIVMLHRVAEVYPAMDHAEQSRYGQLSKARGIYYGGKVVNKIWECGLAENVTEAYDDVFDAIDSDTAAQNRFGKSGKEIRAFIEANFLEDAIDAVFSGKIRGNFGMHQSTLVYLGIVRQFGDTDKWFDELLNKSSDQAAILGLNYALYNMTSRDGLPAENAPGYNFIWVSKIAEYGDLLHHMGRDVFAIPKTRRLFDGVLDQVVVTSRTPCIGDSGAVWGDLTGRNAETYQAAFRHYKDNRYARWLNQFGATGEMGFASFESLLYPPVESSEKPGPQKSRVLDGYGQAILNNKKDSVGLSLFYGWRAGHGHFDRMNIDTFVAGAPVTPDLGYPDAMNDYVKGIYTWSKNTISHNTVTVDARKQSANVPGTVKLFADSPFARAIDVDAGAGAYPQCSTYRRAIVMIDVDADRSYFVDFFTVAGGNQHDYSLHGPPGDFETVGGAAGGQWSDPAKGTLAGENVPLGYAYDASEMEVRGYAGGFNTYAGSGFQHLFNVRKLQSGSALGQYQHAKSKDARVRLHILPQPDQQVLLCDARVSPVKHPEILRYFIARTKGQNLTSRFASVIEPYTEKPFIESVTRQESTIKVVRAGGLTDIISYNPDASTVRVTTLDATGQSKRQFSANDPASGSAIQGTVTSVDPETSTIRINLSTIAHFDPASLVGRLVQFKNDIRQTSHPIASAKVESDTLVLTTKDDLIVSKAHIDSAEADTLTTHTALMLAALCRGTTLCDPDYHPLAKVLSSADGKIHLTAPLKDPSTITHKDAWFLNVGPGDEFTAPAISWSEQ